MVKVCAEIVACDQNKFKIGAKQFLKDALLFSCALTALNFALKVWLPLNDIANYFWNSMQYK